LRCSSREANDIIAKAMFRAAVEKRADSTPESSIAAQEKQINQIISSSSITKSCCGLNMGQNTVISTK